MKSAVSPSVDARPKVDPWSELAGGRLKTQVDVRDFSKNYTPYEGDERFLAGAILAYANKLAPTDKPDIGYAMIFPGMTILKILLVNVLPAVFGG